MGKQTRTFEDVPVDQVLLLWPVADSLVQLFNRILVEGQFSNWLRFFSGRVSYPSTGLGWDYRAMRGLAQTHGSRDKVSGCEGDEGR